MENYKDKDWLYDQYVNQKKSMRKIAVECGVCPVTIFKWIHKFEINRPRPLYYDKQWLKKQYSKKTIDEISKEFGFNRSTLFNWVAKHKIGKRRRIIKGNYGSGEFIDAHGYNHIYKPEHPKSDHRGYIKESFMCAEKYLGRLLNSGEIVHHIKWWNKLSSDVDVFPSKSEHSKCHHGLNKIAIKLAKDEFIKGNIIYDKKDKMYKLVD